MKSFFTQHFQRLLLVAVLALIAVMANAKLEGDWTSTLHVTWAAKDYEFFDYNPKTTLTKTGVPITVTVPGLLTNRPLLTRNRIFMFQNAYNTPMTFTASKGYRIRRIIMEDTECNGTHKDRNKATSRFISGDSRYKVDWKFASGSWQDGNNIIIDNYNAPASKIEVHTPNGSAWVKARRISVEYVKDPEIGIKENEYFVAVGKTSTFFERLYQERKDKIDASLIMDFSFSNDAASYVEGSYKRSGTFQVKGNKPGNCTMKVTSRANDDYARGEATTELKLKWLCDAQVDNVAECNVKTYKPAEIKNLHKDYDGKITYKSLTPGIEVDSDNGNLKKVTVDGGWNDKLKIEINVPETENFRGKTLTQTYSYFNNTYPLTSMDDVFDIYQHVNEKGNKKMTIDLKDDIQLANPVSRISGYKGTFLGNGHKITVSGKHGGLFSSVDSATFNNIRLEGLVNISEGKDDYFVGLVDSIKGKTTFKNCQSNVNLLLNEGSCKTMAGFAAYGSPGSTVIFEDCGVNSSFVGEATKAAGFLGETDGKAEFVNCVFTGDISGLKKNDDTTSKATFVNVKDEDKAVFINCYYANPLGQLQGDPATKKDIATGKLAYMLGEGKTWNNLPVWGQDLSDGNSVPQVMFDKEVFGVTFTYKDDPMVTRYVNKGMKVTDPPAAEQYRDERFKDIKLSDLIFGDGFDPYATIIENSMTVSVDLNGELTGIDGVKTNGKGTVRQYYTLQGKYVGNSLDGMPKGVYICNGKKVIKQ